MQGLGSSSYVSSTQLVSTVQGLASSSYVSSTQLISTVQGLGSAGYLSTPFIRVSSISTQSLVVFGESTIIGSCNIFIGNNPSTNILRFYGTTYDGVDNNNPSLNSLYQNTVIAERLYYGGPTQLGTSELLLFKGTNSDNTNAQGPDRVRILASGGFKVDIASNGGAWPINGNPPSTVVEALTVISNGWIGINCNAPSYTLDVYGSINVRSNIYIDGNFLPTTNNTISTVQGLGSSSYISTTQLISTVQGLGSSSYVSTSQLVSTVQGLGSFSYISSTQLVSTVQGLGSSAYVSSSQLISTVQGLGTYSYVSSTQLVSTVQGLGSAGYLSSPFIRVSSISTQSLVVFGESTIIGSCNIFIGNNPSTNVLRFYGTTYDGVDNNNPSANSLYQNTVIAERLYYGGPTQLGTSELLLFKGTNSDNTNAQGPDRVRILASGGFKVDIASNGGAWPINGNPPSTVVEALTVISNGWIGINCNAPSYTLDVEGRINASVDILVRGNALINATHITSTVIGLGTSSYVSSTQLVSTVKGLGLSSYVSSTQLTSTVQGLGSSSYISSLDLVSTVQGLGSSSYVSSLHLMSTVRGLGSSAYVSSLHLVSTVQGLGSSSYISSLDLVSTVRGLGSSAYVSSLHLVSTVQGLGSSAYVSSLHLMSTVQGLGSSAYVSSTHLVSTVQGLGTSGYLSTPFIIVSSISTQSLVVLGSNIFIGNNPSTNMIRFYGTIYDGYDSISAVNPLYENTVIAERLYYSGTTQRGTSELLLFKGNDGNNIDGPDRVRVLASGGFKVDIASNGGSWPVNGNPPSTMVEALTVISNGWLGLNCNVPAYTLDVNGSMNVLSNIYINTVPILNKDDIVSTVRGLGSSAYVSSTHIVSTVQGLGSSGYISSVNGVVDIGSGGFVGGYAVVNSDKLRSTVQGLGSSAYVSSLHLVSTVQGLGSSGYVSSLHLVSTVQGLGSSGYVSSLHLVSTVQGLGSSGYVSSLHLVSTVQGLGSSGYVSSLHLASTVQGIGSSGYVSSLHLVSTVQGIGSSGYVSSFHLASTVQGLGSSGYLSSVGGVLTIANNVIVNGLSLVNSDNLTSTVKGLGSSAYVSSLHLASTLQGLGSSGYVSSLHLASTIQGLGSSGYVSSFNIASTVQGLGSSGYVSSSLMASTVRGLGSSGYVSSVNGVVRVDSNIFVNGFPVMTQQYGNPLNTIYNSNLLIGASASTNTIRFFGTAYDGLSPVFPGTDDTATIVNSYAATVIGERLYSSGPAQLGTSELVIFKGVNGGTDNSTGPDRVRILSAGGFKVDIAENGKLWIPGSNIPNTTIEALTINCNGYIGIQCNSPAYTLDINGNMRATGNVTGTDVIATSDFRLKTNILTIDSPLEKISAMRGVYFHKISHSTIRKVGVIAQEIETVLPEVVFTEDTEEKMKGVSYGNITSILIEGIKAQQSSIQSLVTTISSLQSQIVLLQRSVL